MPRQNRHHYRQRGTAHSAARAAGHVYTGVKRVAGYLAGGGKKARMMQNPRVNEDATQLITRRRRTIGKFKRPGANIDALVRANEQMSLWRWQRISQFDTASGSLPVNFNTAVSVQPFVRYPLYMFDLEATPNNFRGTIYNPPVAWRLCGGNTTPAAQLYFDNTVPVSQDATGVNSANRLYPENLPSAATNAASIPNRRCIQRYVELKMMMYGTTKYPVRWLVQIVTLKDDWLHPDWWADSSVTPTDPFAGSAAANQNLVQNRNAFWQAMVAPFVSNPINVQDPLVQKQLKVVQTVCSFTMEPKLSTEPGTVPHQERQDCFYKQDKMLKFDWDDQTLIAGAITSVGYQNPIADTQAQTRPRGRHYLMIRAQVAEGNPTVTNPPTVDAARDPSMDIFIRKKIVTLA